MKQSKINEHCKIKKQIHQYHSSFVSCAVIFAILIGSGRVGGVALLWLLLQECFSIDDG
jgi:hypothetical protein